MVTIRSSSNVRPVMIITVEEIEIRFTANGKRMARIYAKDLKPIQFQIWDKWYGAVSGAIIDGLMDLVYPPNVHGPILSVSVEIVGKLHVVTYSTKLGPQRVNTFVIDGWRQLDKNEKEF